MHLTNYSLNKKSMDYVRCDNPDVEDYGNKWSMSAMLRYLRESGIDTSELLSRIEDVIVKSIISVELPVATATKMFVPNPRGNCVELYGFDILIDDNLKPWVLEVNLSPSLATDAPLDLKIKSNCMSDWLNLAGISLIDPVSRNNQNTQKSSQNSSKSRPQSSRAQSSVTPTQDRDLSSEESKILKWARDQDNRKGGFLRIFPRPDSWEKYGKYLQHRTTYNSLLARRLFRDFQVATPIGVDNRNTTNIPIVSKFARNRAMAERVLQYERKLLNMVELKEKSTKEKVKKKVKKKSNTQVSQSSSSKKLLSKRPNLRPQTAKNDFSAYKPKSDLIHKSTENNHTTVILKEKEKTTTTSTTFNHKKYSDLQTGPENIENKKPITNIQKRATSPVETQKPQNPPQMQKILNRVQLRARPNSAISAISASDPSNTVAQANLRIRAKKIYHQLKTGPNDANFLSAIEARRAFHSYLCRVQIRLTHEACLENSDKINISEQKQEQQLALVTRFLVRAAENLPTPLPITVPSKDQFNLITRKKLIASQLSIFVNKYQIETDRQKSEQQHTDSESANKDFDIFVRNGSENELEDVLTLYTKRNKSAAIFLGTKPKPKEINHTKYSDNLNEKGDGKQNKIQNNKLQGTDKNSQKIGTSNYSITRVRHRPPSAPSKTILSNDEKRVIEAMQKLSTVSESSTNRTDTPSRPWR